MFGYRRSLLAALALAGAIAVVQSSVASARTDTGVLHACIGTQGFIRVSAHCRPAESAVGVQIVPLAHAASAHAAKPSIRPHTITGRQVKVGSLPGSDITRGTLPASALTASRSAMASS